MRCARTPGVFTGTATQRRERYPDLETPTDDVEATAALPLVVGKRAIGTITFDFPSTAVPGNEERTFLGALAHQCAQAIDRARLYVGEMRAKEAIAAVHRVRRRCSRRLPKASSRSTANGGTAT